MMSQPTFITMPASTACGTGSTTAPNPSSIPRMRSAHNAPDTRVVPPALVLVTVPIVAPAPGRPPNTPETMLPIPWPTSSRSGL